MIIYFYSIKNNFILKNIKYISIFNKFDNIGIYNNHIPLLIYMKYVNIIIINNNNNVYKKFFLKSSLIEINNKYINIFKY